ncbi:MAG: hypothetical protein Q8L48_30765 [Archangium sp.]|nr:hypothetical protein [Archangium sp.]
MRSLLLFALLLAACTKKEADLSPAPLPKAVTAKATPKSKLAFELATPKVTDEAAPARYRAALPTTTAGIKDAPPDEFISLQLDASPALRAQVLAALETATKDVPLSRELGWYYDRVFGYSPSAQTCTWMGSVLPSAGARVKEVLYGKLTRCHDPKLALLFERADAPDEQVVEFYFERGEGLVPFSPRFAAAAKRLVKNAATAQALRPIGFGFAHMQGPVLKEVEALQRSTHDAQKRATLALGLLHSPNEAAKALGRKSCDHPDLRRDAMCTGFFPEERDEDDPLAFLSQNQPQKPGPDAGVEDVLAYFGPVSAEFPKRFGVPAYLATLERCAKKADDQAAQCLLAMSQVDRAALQSFLKIHSQRLAKKPGDLGVVARTLTLFPEGGLHARLVKAMLLPSDAKDTERQSVTVEGMLVAADRLERFDVETGTFPNGHHVLLARLAKLAPPLEGALFEEVAPPEDQMDDGPYELHAFLSGKRYAVRAENHGDWYDTAAVLGLLNALLIEQKSELRFVTLPTGDQTASVLVGPLPALEALQTDGLLELADSEAAMKDGKAFEEEVFRKLKGAE